MTVTFRRKDASGAILDSGESGEVTSISPVLNGESLSQEVLRRPSDSLRSRTDELSRAVYSLEYLVQSAVNSSTLLRYISTGGDAAPCLLKLYSKDFDGSKVYYISPDAPAEDSTGTKPSIVVIGSSTNTYNYIVNSSALSAFFSSGSEPSSSRVDNHNKYFGLSKVGDTLCIRVPLVGSDYLSENLLPRTTSLANPAGTSVFPGTLLEALTDSSIALTADDARSSLLKLSSRNSVTLSVAEGSALSAFLETQAVTVNEDKASGETAASLEIKDSNDSYPYMALDLNGVVKLEDNMFRLPRAGYWDFEGLADHTSDFTLRINGDATTVTLVNDSVGFPSDAMLPPNEYLHPLATHTGDSILIPGLGGVRLSDIESRDDSAAYMDTAGRILGETGTAVSTYKTRTRISYEDLSTAGSLRDLLINGNQASNTRDYFRLPIDVTVPEAGLGEKLYLSDLRISMVLDESYSAASDVIDSQKVRDVFISIGAYDLKDTTLHAALTYPQTGSGTRFSLEKTIPGLPNTVVSSSEVALPGLILTNFNLKNNMQDDYTAVVELPDSITSMSLLGKTILVWVYREDPTEDFFITEDRGSFRIDLHFTWSTRLGDSVNLASAAALADLNG